ncbi:hypothetical protein GGS24DRAFT_499330 [Hypoxylon argillaceum]|nr:hypothetical protein GGS24DRAFT_499330 [Hypoxylon argillaceum]
MSQLDDSLPYTGVDATSIWAAATSAEHAKGGAIHVHLLACILTIWEPAEAISIWVELVEERRRVIANDLENGAQIPFALATAAAQQEITREELADWDRSARAWIETANNIMLKRHTQLRLILKNMSLPIGRVESVYPSVIEAWRNALTIMECLISGIPQEVNDGAALLGLSYWHLYPNLLIFGSRPVEVYMGDGIFPPGGVLSLGCSPSAIRPSNGISWSLSLAHMRYYGRPVRKEAMIREDPSRLTPSEFSQVILGCLMGNWDIAREKETATLMCLRDLSAYILAGKPSRGPRFDDCAFSLLGDASSKLLANHEMGDQLIALGRKRSNFLPTTVKGPQIEMKIGPLFCLTTPSIFLGCLSSHEERIEYLRRVGGRLDGLEPLSPIIRYQVAGQANSTEPHFEYATLFPIDDHNCQDDGVEPSTQQKYMRWIDPSNTDKTTLGSLRATHEEIIVENNVFHSNTTAQFSRTICGDRETTYNFLGGDSELAAVFYPNDILHDASTQRRRLSKVDIEDIHWAVTYSLFDRDNVESVLETAMIALFAKISWGLGAFRTLPERIIRVETLLHPLIDRSWVRGFEITNSQANSGSLPPSIALQISIISDLVGGVTIAGSIEAQ